MACTYAMTDSVTYEAYFGFLRIFGIILALWGVSVGV
jgi:hypothetical protein